MQAHGAISVAIIEDDPLTREGLGILIGGTPGYRCVAQCGSVAEAQELPAGVSPDVILLDIHLPGVPGTQGVPLLKSRFPQAEVVMLTVFAEDDKVFESICNGASGYVLKRTPPVKLLDAISEAHAGGAPMSPEIARKVVKLFRATRAETVSHNLTPREIRLLSLLSEGHSYQAASEAMSITINSVRNYIRSIYEKLHVHSKSAAVSEALRRQIIS